MNRTLFIRLLHHEDKGAALVEKTAALREGRADGDIYTVNPDSFQQVPNTTFCYWVSERIRRLFGELSPFESEGRTVKQGLATADDFRFVRAWWEVPGERVLDGGRWPVAGGQSGEDKEGKWTEERIREFQEWCRQRTYEGKRWAPFAKGGEYSPYYADIHLVVNWEIEGAEIKQYIVQRYPYLQGNWEWVAKNADYYFRPGLTWPRRTQQFGIRALTAGAIFADKGPAAFTPAADDKELLSLLSFMLSRPFGMLVELSLNAADKTARSFEVGILQGVPIPKVTENGQARLATLAQSTWSLKRSLDLFEEVSHAFTLPALLQVQGETITERAAAYEKKTAETEAALRRIQSEIDEIIFDLYGFTEEERKPTVGNQGPVVGEESEGDDSVGEEETIEAAPGDNRPLITALFFSWSIGVAFGRCDIRLALDPSLVPGAPDPFEPLPVCPPGMLVGPDGLPAKPGGIVSEEWLRARPDANTLPPDSSVSKSTIPDSEYPLRINWNGILVDDPGHEDDIVRRVREVLEVIWENRAEAIEKEACEILGVRELRDYFRKPGKGGFWMDHVKRYSKSRRKAPIYWYLRSAKGNYGLWLYYHRLDKDILFKALLNYVEPKIRLEEDRLNTLRAHKEAVGSSGREAKQIEKEMDLQEQFVSELRGFADKLRRVADLHLEPDLNDGVILNIAPLWELVPWKEAKKYWEALQEGKYDWSHIAYQLWPERVEDLCRKDRSIAIAHGREDLCEVKPPRASRKKRVKR